MDSLKMWPRRDFTRNFQSCDLCPFRTKSGFFKIHHIKHHQNVQKLFKCNIDMDKYQCLYCEYNTEKIIEMNGHLKKCDTGKLESLDTEMQTTSKYYFCRKCKFQTYSLLIWWKHTLYNCVKFDNATKHITRKQQKQKKVTSFKCDECNFEFKWKRSLKLHLKLRHMKTYTLNSKGHATIQYFTEDQIKQFKCGLCDYKAKRTADLKKHVLHKHFKDEMKWLKCEQCTYKTTHKSNLNCHVKTHHLSEDKIKCFKCELCDYKSKWKNAFQLHVMSKHCKDEMKWLKCEQCTYKTKHKHSFNRHVRIQHLCEDEIKWFKCELCDHKTKWKHALQLHVMYQHFKDKIEGIK